MSTGAAGLPATNKLPKAVVNVVFGASPTGASGNQKVCLLFAQKSSAGTATEDTVVYDSFAPTDSQTLGGIGSDAHLGALAFFAAQPFARLKHVFPAQPGGAQATQTITVGASNSIGSGNLTVWIHGVQLVLGILAAQTRATLTTALVNLINGSPTALGVTAAGNTGTGVVTITARCIGTLGNLIKLRLVLDTTVTGTSFTLGGAALTSGSGTASYTTAITTSANSLYKVLTAAAVDTTNLLALQTKLLSDAGPSVGRREVGISSSIDTLANATTVAQLLNEARFQVVWHQNAEDLPVQLAAGWSAIRSVATQNNPSENLSAWSTGDITDCFQFAHAQPLDTDRVSDTQAAAALDVGLTPIQVRASDKHPILLRSITTHSQDTGGNPDVRTLDTNMVDVPDALADDVVAFVPSAFTGKVLADEEQSGQDPLPDNVATPSMVKTRVYSMTVQKYVRTGMLKNFAADFADWDFSLAPSPSVGRVNATMPIHPAPWFLQFSASVLQRS